MARRADQLPQILERILAGRCGKLVGERTDGESVRDIEHRAVPADTDMVCGRAVLAPHIRNVVGHVGEALLQFTGAPVCRIGLKRRLDRREHGPVQPRRRAALGIERRFEVLGADRVIVVVLDIVGAGPGDLDRRAELLRQQCRLRDVIGF